MNTNEISNNNLAKSSLILGIVSIASISVLPGVAAVVGIFVEAFLGNLLDNINNSIYVRYIELGSVFVSLICALIGFILIINSSIMKKDGKVSKRVVFMILGAVLVCISDLMHEIGMIFNYGGSIICALRGVIFGINYLRQKEERKDVAIEGLVISSLAFIVIAGLLFSFLVMETGYGYEE